jgi:transposase
MGPPSLLDRANGGITGEEEKNEDGKKGGAGELFLYDVTSSHLEETENYFGAYGYNRDGKRGKQQIVIGLLCDGNGNPVSVEVFAGNTQDVKTFASRVRKLATRFGWERVTFIGNHGRRIKAVSHLYIHRGKNQG